MKREPCLLVALALTGCMVGPAFHPPAPAVPAHFSSVASTAPAWPRPGWWKQFHSPELDRLMEAAQAHNFSVIAAIDELEAANAKIEIAGAPLLPTLNFNGTGNFEQLGTKAAGAGAASGFSSTSRSSDKTIDTRQFTASFAASYELDFWGKNHDVLRAAQASAAAAQFNAATVALTEEASVATAYFQMLAYQDQLAIAQNNYETARGLLNQLQAEFRSGVIDEPTVQQQAALVAQERASIPNLASQMKQEAIGLGILTGQAPEFLEVQGGTLNEVVVPALAPDLPSALLNRRPDVAEAEATLIADNDNVRGAIAAFFPSITLTGSAGRQSTALNTLLSPGSSLLSAATSITQPIFDGGELAGTLKASHATYHEDVAKYEQAVVQAFSDVETAMTALHYATRQEELQRIAVQRAQAALDGAQAKMRAGVTDISTVLNAEQTLLSDQNALVTARLTRLEAAVDLYKAMGGGWVLDPHDLPAKDVSINGETEATAVGGIK